MSRLLITDPDVQAAIEALPDEPIRDHDPRLAYELSKEQAYRAWPCMHVTQGPEWCHTRRDEHADQVEGRWPSYDITDHEFVEVL